ncbi:MAG: hypothetical protein AAF293_05550 [Pseudomonadota bacterium]
MRYSEMIAREKYSEHRHTRLAESRKSLAMPRPVWLVAIATAVAILWFI